jgi:hypothetical protein
VTRHRARVLGLSAALGLVLPAAAACGIQPSGIVALGPAPAATGGGVSAAGTLSTSSGATQFQLFFYQDGQLSPVYRPAVKGEVTETVVLDALRAGPTPAELAKGYSTLLSPKLTASVRANGLLAAYTLDMPLGQRAKAQFICTMQFYDQSVSVGIQVAGSAIVNWNACSDTTDSYVPMQGDPSIATAQNQGIG